MTHGLFDPLGRVGMGHDVLPEPPGLLYRHVQLLRKPQLVPFSHRRVWGATLRPEAWTAYLRAEVDVHGRVG
jgi:hypothetical protein